MEVRFEDLSIETDVAVGSRALPSVSNNLIDMASVSSAPRQMCRQQVAVTCRRIAVTALHDALVSACNSVACGNLLTQ